MKKIASKVLAALLALSLLFMFLPIESFVAASQARHQAAELPSDADPSGMTSHGIANYSAVLATLLENSIVQIIGQCRSLPLSAIKQIDQSDRAQRHVKMVRYFIEHDLKYNLPRVVYRHSSGEHASEG